MPDFLSQAAVRNVVAKASPENGKSCSESGTTAGHFVPLSEQNGTNAQSTLFPPAAQSVPQEFLMRTLTLVQSAFADAAATWLETRRAYISQKTIHEYELNIRTLSCFFTNLHLPDITADDIRLYQKARSKGEGVFADNGPCGPFAINHELSVLQQMLKRIKRWPEIAPDYRPLPLPKQQPGRVLSDTEKARLLRISKENENWRAAYLFAVISVNTTAGPKEVATLRLRDIELNERIILIQPEGAKNPERIRPIALNTEAHAAVISALQRAHELGSSDPEDYLFPFRVNRKLFDPKRHQTSFKTAWKKMTVAAQLGGIRPYDLRRTAITNLLSKPHVSEETVTKLAGHVDRKMLKRYSYNRLDKMREAVESLCATKKPPSSEKPRRSAKTEENTAAIARELVTVLSKLLKTR